MKLFKKFMRNVAEYKSRSINSAFIEFKGARGLYPASISGRFFSFSGLTDLKGNYAYLYSIENYKRGKNKHDKKVNITYYVIPMELIKMLNLKIEQKRRYFIIK